MSVAARQLPMYDQAMEALQATNEQLSSYGVRCACSLQHRSWLRALDSQKGHAWLCQTL